MSRHIDELFSGGSVEPTGCELGCSVAHVAIARRVSCAVLYVTGSTGEASR
jgi:hypothetical protein